MKLARKVDWEQRLFQFIEGKRHRAFVWGEHDCCLFAAAAIIEMTGVDLASAYRGRYEDAKGAAKFGQLASLVDAAGLPRMRNVNLARRGDIMLLEIARPTLGVCLGAQIAAPGIDGLIFIPMRAAQAGWRV